MVRVMINNNRQRTRKELETFPIAAIELWGLAKKQKLKCALSGRQLTNLNISPDHIIPISKGGIHSISNIRLVDRDINIARQSLSDEEFIQLCKDVINHQLCIV
jgi:hypothetical protein